MLWRVSKEPGDLTKYSSKYLSLKEMCSEEFFFETVFISYLFKRDINKTPYFETSDKCNRWMSINIFTTLLKTVEHLILGHKYKSRF